MQWTRKLRVAAVLTSLFGVLLCATGCGARGDQPAVAVGKGGASIVMASYNFTDSQILGELYAHALEVKNYPVQRRFGLGSRNLAYTGLRDGALQFLPDYQGAAITTFGATASKDADSEHRQLAELLAPSAVSLLNFAPAENKNNFIVKTALATDNGLTKISDLAKLDKVVLGGGPSCERAVSCFLGLKGVYQLANASFQASLDAGTRLDQLKSGALTAIVVDSVNPLVGDPQFIALRDDKGIVPTENIVPVVSRKVLEERGADFAAVVNAVSAKLTTEELRGLNQRVAFDGEQIPDAVREWLTKQGLT